ncbi:MAG TPA: dihydropteroate synthase [Pyrinomonadaceae bacterium]|jgi:dihydropteroate synthase
MNKFWQTSKRRIETEAKTLVMAILNVTPDSFSDGGKFFVIDEALRQAEKLIAEGADILDVGGESTRPNAERVSADEETRRVVPVVEAIVKRFDVPVSIDTSKAAVAEHAVGAGAEIINDVSGLRFDERIGEVAAKYQTGIVLMHLRGTFETMHKLAPVKNIFAEVTNGFHQSIEKARAFGVGDAQIALDVGIGFSKTFDQNLELIAKLDKLIAEFPEFPMLVGASRKSFVGKILGDDVPPDERINGSLGSAAIAAWNGANIVRVHDVKSTVEIMKVVGALKTKI